MCISADADTAMGSDKRTLARVVLREVGPYLKSCVHLG
jgi:hypothetical protein